jgi:hypothetical protein
MRSEVRDGGPSGGEPRQVWLPGREDVSVKAEEVLAELRPFAKVVCPCGCVIERDAVIGDVVADDLDVAPAVGVCGGSPTGAVRSGTASARSSTTTVSKEIHELPDALAAAIASQDAD